MRALIIIGSCLFFVSKAYSYNSDSNFSASLSYEYAHWTPSEVQYVEMNTVGKNIVSLQLDIAPSLPFMGKFRYWATPDSSPEQKRLIESESKDSSLEKYLGNLQIPLYEDLVSNEYGAIFLEYERMAFSGTAIATSNFEYAPFGEDLQTISNGSELQFLTIFKVYTIGWHYSYPWGQFRAAYDNTKYSRPFNIRSKGVLLDDTAYDAVFYGEALKLTFENGPMISQSTNWEFRLGIAFPLTGDIRFAQNDSLDKLLGEDRTVAYFKKFFSLRYNKPVTEWLDMYISYDYESILFSTGEKTANGFEFTSENEELDIAKERIQSLGIGLELHF
jgi:hypothetical protein